MSLEDRLSDIFRERMQRAAEEAQDDLGDQVGEVTFELEDEGSGRVNLKLRGPKEQCERFMEAFKERLRD